LETYLNRNLDADELKKAHVEQAIILEKFDKVSHEAPIRTDEDYDAVNKKTTKRSWYKLF
jgi:hypothetical protein